MQQFTINLPTLKEIEMALFRKLQEQFAEAMVRILEELDQWTMEKRDRARYRMQERRKVSLSTLFGEITFSRRMYKDRQKGCYVYLLDQVLGFDGENMISPQLEELAIELASKGPSYRASASMIEQFLGYPALSHETIRSRLLSCAGPSEPAPQEKRKARVLFVEVDGLYTHLQRNRRQGMENRIAVVHEGWKREGERTSLLHKRYYLHTGKESFWEGFGDFLIKHYDIDEETWLVVNGDGAEWIGECTSYFHRCVYTLDRFHVARDLRRYLKDLPDRWDAAYQALKAYDPKALLGVLETVGKEDMPEEYWEDWGKFKAFLKRHREHLRDYRTKLREAGIDTSGMRPMGSAESQMQVMAKRTKHGGYSWSVSGVRAMLHTIMARQEGRSVVANPAPKSEQRKLPPVRVREILKKSKQRVTGYVNGMIRLLRTSAQSSPTGRALKGLRG
jgi:hypothetical protein